MKCSESWLREWVNPAISRDDLCETLTMAGLEVEEIIHASQLEEAGLASDDYIIDIAITPNRGDCLSIKGMAREIAALTKSQLKTPVIAAIKAQSATNYPVTVENKKACPVYIGRVIKNVKADASTPAWLTERLHAGGIRSINPIVDVTNYVMLELGQPMHAFDLDTLEKKISVRLSKHGEQITLLDGSEKKLDDATLIIADEKQPLAIAGVMGGINSGVTSLSKNIFLESAFFQPEVVARQRQYYGLNSDSAYRFERGVDPCIQQEAIERATQLILEIAGGEAGEIIPAAEEKFFSRSIILPHEKIGKILGISLTENEVDNIFKLLHFTFKHEKNNWIVEVPSWRSDITLPEDLIEEIARLHGYDNIPVHTLEATLQPAHANENAKDLQPLKQLLADQGYHEIISYSFVDRELQKYFSPDETPIELVNPITAEMTVMRTNLWPGLLQTLQYNKSRQQQRVRLFEIGTCFANSDTQLLQETRLAGLISGLVYPEQWSIPSRQADFFDLKGDLEHLFRFLHASGEIVFKSETHPGFHPHQTAGIYQDEILIGVVGALHPATMKMLDLSGNVFLHEIALFKLKTEDLSHAKNISKFPEIRRDIALMINEAIPSQDIQDTIKVIAGDWLKDVFIFDVYQGKGISPGLKSIAVALILQHPSRTLVDDEVTALMERVITALKRQLGAELRR